MSLTQYRDIVPPRWYWETLLLEALTKNGPVSYEKRCLAFLVCLALATVTPDLACIAATIALDNAGFLSVDALAAASWEDIFPMVKKSGLGVITASNLVEMGKQLKELGHMPFTLGQLLRLSGIGPKAANVYANELLGLRLGIPADRHVEFICLALGIHLHPGWVERSVRFVEQSLRTWVNVGDYRVWNPVLGGMAQLFGQFYRTFNTSAKVQDARKIVWALSDHIHEHYDIELIWFAIGRIRAYYLVERKRSKPAQSLMDLIKEEEALLRESKGLPPVVEAEEKDDRKMPPTAVQEALRREAEAISESVEI